MKEAIRQRAKELGFDICRFTEANAPDHAARFEQWLKDGRHGAMAYLARNAHKRVDPQQVLAGAKSIVVVAASYWNGEQQTPNSHHGQIARYARYADYHDVLADRLKQLSEFVNQLGGSEAKSLWYVDTGPLLERDLAQRAGVGFIGKHTNVISRELGNWFFLAEIITTVAVGPDASEPNRCGTCHRCIDACPTNAITAPFQLDARRCISYLTIELKDSIPVEFRPAIGNRIYGCDDCLTVCPWNKFAKTGALMAEHRRTDLDQAELLDLLALDDVGFKKRFAGTPMLRTKRRGLLRNVCVALGNVAGETALPALEKAATDPEPLIAEHARWAIEQIKGRFLVVTNK
ncbi:MAG: tRNA epoxyqueuosine(34) reductase QueG [Limisphaerales bacterium]